MSKHDGIGITVVIRPDGTFAAEPFGNISLEDLERIAVGIREYVANQRAIEAAPPVKKPVSPALSRLAQLEPAVEGQVHYDMNERLGHTHPDMPPIGAFILKVCGGASLSRLQIQTLIEARTINQTTYPSAEFLFASTPAFMDYIQEVPGYLEKMNRRVTPGEMISVICSYTMKAYGWLEYAAAHRVSDHSEGEMWTSSL